MIRKLRIKFVCVNMIFAILMLAVIFSTILYSTKFGLERDSVSLLKRVADQPLYLARPGEGDADVLLPFFSVEMNKSGEIVSINGGYFELADPYYLRVLVESTFDESGSIGVLEEYNLRYYHVPGFNRVIFMDITSENKTIANLIRNFLITGGLSLAVFFFISIRLSRWAVRPVEFAWQQQKRFVADASHELKTPLTVILTNAGMIRANQYDPKLLPRLTDNILEEAKQMRSLVENLLSLAKADDGLPKTERKKTDLSTAALHECLLFEPMFYEKECKFTYDIERGIHVAGNELQLRQVVEILLDNACKYTAQGGKVKLGLKSSDAKHCLLKVENEGEEISPEQIELIFDRFYRGDKARSAGDGHGLGLSIASGIVRNHEGQIWAESSGGINTFCVKLRKLR